MEQCLQEAQEAAENLHAALDRCKAISPQVEKLKLYYESPLWRQDFEDDEAGKFPADLKRGVLSEDAVYNLLEEWDRLCSEWKTV